MHPNDWQTRQDARAARRQARWERREARRAAGYGPHPLGGVVFGLLLIGGGLLFLLRNLNIVYFDNLWDYWPVALIVIGGSKLFAPRHSNDVMGGVIIGGAGVLLLLRNLDIVHFRVWGVIWPLAFIVLGGSLLLRNLYGPDWFHGGTRNPDTPPAPGTEMNRLNVDLLFSEADTKVLSQDFEGGRVSVLFSGATIDLRGAAVTRPEITIQADAVFGGIELRVPDNWHVESRGSGVFGGYDDRTHHPPQSVPGPKVVVRGAAVFGGVSVRN